MDLNKLLSGKYFFTVITALVTEQNFTGTEIKATGSASDSFTGTDPAPRSFPIPDDLIAGTMPTNGRTIKVDIVGRSAGQGATNHVEGYLTQTSSATWVLDKLSTSTPDDANWIVAVDTVNGDLDITFTPGVEVDLYVSWTPF